ncbi:DUF2306 domain-containing protein [Paenibacillus sp. UNC451MF]|uniref:DUF2306 domain-containing protein n=1 Tax=Paenibacillus sp. UNC451MF TaxID=1449063 RepID=UPI00048F2732|nr:DUF2306 domain-containing protein [Paenibacillus sp. UNC451MF]
MVKKISIRLIVSFLAFVLLAYVIMQYGFADPHKAGLITQKLKKPDFHYAPWIYVLYVHIVTACLAVAIGPFQLFIRPKRKGVRRHRMLGYAYVLSITASGLISIYLSIFATGGWMAGLGFFVLDVLWVLSTWVAVRKAVNKQIQAHREWMLRSYALTLAAVTFRVWLLALTPLFGGPMEPPYRLSAWMCWIGNLIFIEVLIRLSRKKAVSKSLTA